jgi:hypothetical protein
MGLYDEFDPDSLPEEPDPERGADGRKQNDRAPLVGEVEVFHPHRHYRRNSSGQRDYDEQFIREVIAYRIMNKRKGLRFVADKFGVSVESVRRWTQAEVDRRAFADVPKLRAEASMMLHTAMEEAWGIYQAAVITGSGKLALDALTRLESLVGTDAKLMGLNLPVKVDVNVTEVTEAERELQEIINEAKAKEAAREADVIARASEDPDL